MPGPLQVLGGGVAQTGVSFKMPRGEAEETLWCHQNYDAVTWVRGDSGERPLIHTGLTLRGQTGEK